MRPQYILLLMYAVFITGLADGISWALAAVPGVGFILAFAITFCINATMGAGLILALASFGMFHPRFGPFGVSMGLLPGLNFLPFWVGLVVAGIVYKMNEEGKGGVIASAVKLQTVYQNSKNPFAAMKAAAGIVMNERLATGRPEAPQEEQEEPQQQQQQPERAPRIATDLKSPTINSDISRRTQPHVQAA